MIFTRIKPFTVLCATLCISLIGSSLWLSSCSEEETPPPSVTGISPKAGVPGMEITINGTNFSTGCVVRFNGITASPTTVTETQLVVKVPDDATTGGVTVTTEGGTTQSNDFRVYQVYVAGNERLEGGKAIVKIWQNGKADPISDGSEHATATGFVMVGTDTYISGHMEPFSGNTIPVYWKNKTVVNLPFETRGVTTDIEVSGADVYVSGYVDARATIWKNAAPMTIERPDDTESRVFAIAVVGNDVYAVGDIENTAVYWKNGVATKFGTENEFRFNDIQVVGSDVYIAGWEGLFPESQARYWKNATINNVGTGPGGSGAFAISILNADVYVGGNEAEGVLSLPKFWKNGTSQPITDGAISTYFYAMAVVDGDVISAGVMSSNAVFYAVNNNVFPYSTSNSGLPIGGVIVK
jgi:hypothetical protein